jgi:DnaJ-class molecular chaperone
MIDLSFEEFLELYGEELSIEFAESGADREFEFDLEREQEDRYFEYLEKKGSILLNGVFIKKREECESCLGTGLCTTFFNDDHSSCMTCNGKGYFEYFDKKGPTSGPTNKKRDLPFS